MARNSRLPARYTQQSSVPEASPSTWPALCLHVIALGFHLNAFRLLFEPSPVTEYMNKQYGRQWSFLTVLALAVSTLTFATALAKDLFPSYRILDRIKTSLSIVIVPVEGLVSVLYWTMQFIDPSLLTPPGQIFVIPLFLDLSIHAAPALFLWTDFLVFSPRMSKQANPLLISATATFAYTTWMEWTATKNGHFPYPFLNDMTKVERSVFYLCMVPVLLGLYYVSNGLHDLVRGKNDKTQADAAQRATRKVEDKLN